MDIRLSLPYSEEDLKKIKTGDKVILSGTLYVGRDQAHKRMCQDIKSGKSVPFDFKGNAIYYMGPSPSPPGCVIGSSGPTTSSRMDSFSPFLVENGLKVMVGKGPRSKEVIDSIKKYGGLYLQAFGGCGALYHNAIKSSEPIAYEEFGPEAILRLKVEDFPTICLIDYFGNVFSPNPN